MMKKSPALLDHCCDLVVYPTAGAVVVQTKVPPNSFACSLLWRVFVDEREH
jgi:hypothetical protein